MTKKCVRHFSLLYTIYENLFTIYVSIPSLLHSAKLIFAAPGTLPLPAIILTPILHSSATLRKASLSSLPPVAKPHCASHLFLPFASLYCFPSLHSCSVLSHTQQDFRVVFYVSFINTLRLSRKGAPKCMCEMLRCLPWFSSARGFCNAQICACIILLAGEIMQ